MIDGWEIDAIYKYIILIGESFLVVLLAAIFFVLEHKTSFKKIKWIYRQIIIGVVFGGAAVFGTELGVTVGSSVANVRDAAPLVAGLIFGGPAGMIAATIGSVERILYSLVFHNYTGYFSMVACVIATFLSGIYAWALRKWFFEEKTPNWLFGFATAIIMEVIHFIILYLGHIKNPQEVLTIIKNIAVAMMLANGIGVALACLVVRLLEYGLNNKKHERHRGSINNKVQLGLLILILVTATMSTTFVFTIQNNAAYENAEYALTLNTTDVSQYIREYSNNIMLGAADTAAADYAYEPGGNEKLIEMKEGYGFTEVSLVALHDTDTHEAGEIIYSSNEDDIGFNLVGDDTDYTFYYVHEDVSEYGEAITVFNYIERYDEEIKVAAFTVPSDDEPEYYILVNMNEHDFYEYSN